MCSSKLVAVLQAFSLSDFSHDWKPAALFICTCPDTSHRLTKHFVLLFGKLVEGGLDEVTFEMIRVFVPVLNGGVLWVGGLGTAWIQVIWSGLLATVALVFVIAAYRGILGSCVD